MTHQRTTAYCGIVRNRRHTWSWRWQSQKQHQLWGEGYAWSRHW